MRSDDVRIAALNLQKEIELTILPGLGGLLTHSKVDAFRRATALDVARFILCIGEVFHVRLIDRQRRGRGRIANSYRRRGLEFRFCHQNLLCCDVSDRNPGASRGRRGGWIQVAVYLPELRVSDALERIRPACHGPRNQKGHCLTAVPFLC